MRIRICSKCCKISSSWVHAPEKLKA